MQIPVKRKFFRMLQISQCNLQQLRSAPPQLVCISSLKSDVIGTNSKLLQSVAKVGCLAVKLARDRYFGDDVMCASTVSGLPKDKLKEIKERLYEVYCLDNLVKFQPTVKNAV